jgi:hypothetical protein
LDQREGGKEGKGGKGKKEGRKEKESSSGNLIWLILKSGFFLSA